MLETSKDNSPRDNDQKLLKMNVRRINGRPWLVFLPHAGELNIGVCVKRPDQRAMIQNAADRGEYRQAAGFTCGIAKPRNFVKNLARRVRGLS
jgi:hypothetical protein